MKKFITILMTVVLLFLITGCAGEKNNKELVSDTSSTNISKNTENKDSLPQDSDEKTLVVYYSATGTTEKIAKNIANIAGAELFVIEPEKEYTSDDLDWTDKNSRVSIEHDNPENRDVKLKTVKPDNFEQYETVFIGYPIWWGIAAWPVDNFVKENDFTGKTVIPFCTAASSDIGESGKLLSDMAGTGEWINGKRFYSNSSEEEISNWFENLNLK